MFKAIIFDFFDVIRTDAFKAWLQAHGYTREGGFAEASDLMDQGRISDSEFLNRLSALSGQPVAELTEEMDSGAQIDGEVMALIQQLHKDYKIGLLSNSASSFIRSLLREHSLERHFDEIVVSSEVGFTKPQPEMFQLILSKMAVAPEDAIFIDDNPQHTKGASALGITSLTYTGIVSLKGDLQRLGILASDVT